MMEHHAEVGAEVKAFHITIAQGRREHDMAFGYDSAAGSFHKGAHSANALVRIEFEDHY